MFSTHRVGSWARRDVQLFACPWADMRAKKTTGSPLPLFVRPRQVPELFGISERQVRQLMMRGDLKEGLHWFKKSSRMVLLSVQALEEWIKEG